MPHPLEDYLKELRAIRSTGAAVDELSFYPPLAELLNAVGGDLDSEVRCVMNLRNHGAGLPDGGLFTKDQLQDCPMDRLVEGQKPARGAIEVKGTGDEVRAIADGGQVRGYLEGYGLVLVTNYRDFLLVERGAGGEPVLLEEYRLAASEGDFWAATQTSRKAATDQGERFADFLMRVMTHGAPLSAPEDLAGLLASYAREALARVEEAELPALDALRGALEEALGMTFEGEKGEHFFRSTLVQTLFYGIFSAWVIWSRDHPPTSEEKFDWHAAEWTLHVPMIAALYQQIAQPTRLGPLGIVEVLDWTADALNRVDRASFFDQFDEGQAVQYFYEPFLQAFDPELRKELGVWYTPDEIVRYMVERVDTALREELDIPDGLADPNVYVLDPCCGTGAYLVAVLDRIARTLEERGGDALVAQDIKRAATERVFGFEILPAPFVVSHLQLGLLLRNLGAPLSHDKGERAGVYLTNALTGWEPPEEPKIQLPFPELQDEAEAADHVKRDVPILVVLGNPPYNGFAGMAMGEERDLSDAYRTTERAPKPEGQGLNDLYVRFFRIAERRIVEKSGRGIVCFISNYSWLDARSFSGMRERYYDCFDTIWIDNLHGDRIISEVAPDGRPSQTVFHLRGRSPGIKVGTGVTLLLTSDRGIRQEGARVLYRDFEQSQAEPRRAALREAAAGPATAPPYVELDPDAELGYPFKPRTVAPGYIAWPALPDLFPISFPGVKTSRDDLVVDVEREALTERVEAYLNPQISDEEMARVSECAMKRTSTFDAREARRLLQGTELRGDDVVRYLYRPLDTRWLYWEPRAKLLDRPRIEYRRHVFAGNMWLSAEQRNRKTNFYQPQFARLLADHHLVESNVAMFPLYLRNGDRNGNGNLFSNGDVAATPNLSEHADEYLTRMEGEAEPLFFHVMAALHAPLYAAENAGALRQDWPRIPLPDNAEALERSAELGRQIAALLDTEEDLRGVTQGRVRKELRRLGALTATEGGQLDPDAGDLAVATGWGYFGVRGVTMPGKGRIEERDYTGEELAAIEQGAADLGLSMDEALANLGATTRDIYLNDRAYWRNVPEGVWEYYIGGYQVIKKWLSYREERVLGRALLADEARHVTEMVRRIAAILLLQPALDANYLDIKDHILDWSSVAGE